MQTLLQDLRYGVRMLLRKPSWAALAILTLALGIGANTAIFSVVNAVLLAPLPFSEPERIVRFYGVFSGGNQAATSPPDFLDYRAQNRTLAQLAALRQTSFNLTGGSEPERVLGADITTNFFQTLGVQPLQGRLFAPEEERAGGAQVALISESLWRRRFGATSAALGQTLLLDGASHTIVGVVPQAACLPEDAEVWTPLDFAAPNMQVRRFHFLRAFGRLQPGVTQAQAQADLDVIAAALEKQYPDSNTSWRLRLVPLRDELLGDLRTALYVLFGAVGCVLLIACANVANLLLARAAGRHRELAVRQALGAPAWRIVRQLLTESLLLAFIGGAVGAGLAFWGTEALVKLAPEVMPRAVTVGVNARVLGFTFLLATLTGVMFGLLPAWQAARIDCQDGLKAGGRGVAAGGRRTRHALVVAEIALALTLLAGAGLLLQSFRRLQEVNLGFDPRQTLTLRIFLPEAKYADGKAGLFFDQLLQRVAALPGVQAAGTTTSMPLRGGGDTYFKIAGRPFKDPNAQVTAINPAISHNYLRAQGIPLLKGRAFTVAETRAARQQAVIINEAFAQTYFPGADPLGHHLIIDDGEPLDCEIIGVAGNVKQYSLQGQPQPTMYLPRLDTGFANLVVRTAGEPQSLAAAIRAAVRAIDSDQPVANVQTMEQIVADSVAAPRWRAWLLGVFAALALLLAGIGIYGVMSTLVAQRTHEIGIRRALGAQTRDVLLLVARQGLKLALWGVALGLAVAYGLTRLLASLLFSVSATDPLTFAAVALLLLVVALLACWIPARRAARVDPLVALHVE